ncbi:MAG: Rpn family recombination-promoting nuclease/putative transposase, partial [Prevotellaceae bacterium]|nr:Rpn family recombination-promoting nuclease/putative transposase [Prevotellaceae bacterium]
KKFSIVDVRCRDSFGRQFIVEMQMEWSNAFPHRMLYNVSKAYVDQLQQREPYGKLQPVYGLGLLDEVFDHKTKEFYHHYQMVNLQNTDEKIRGIELVLVELTKFKPERWVDRRMAVLWLRFLREVNDSATEIPSDLQESEEVASALAICEADAYTPIELKQYERNWEYVLKEKMFLDASFTDGIEKGEKKGKAEGLAEGMEKGKAEGLAEGLEKGKAEGKAEGLAEGMEKGKLENKIEMVVNFYRLKVPVDAIATGTGMTQAQVQEILKQHQLM